MYNVKLINFIKYSSEAYWVQVKKNVLSESIIELSQT